MRYFLAHLEKRAARINLISNDAPPRSHPSSRVQLHFARAIINRATWSGFCHRVSSVKLRGGNPKSAVKCLTSSAWFGCGVIEVRWKRRHPPCITRTPKAKEVRKNQDVGILFIARSWLALFPSTSSSSNHFDDESASSISR